MLEFSPESFFNQIQHSCKYKPFDIRTIQTFGVFRPAQLQSLKHIQIRSEVFKQLLTRALKVCYLYDPIIQTLEELQQSDPSLYSSSNNLLKVNSILKILCENLFYRNMIKLKPQSIDSVISLVNNRSTQLNAKVIVAALLVLVSKKMTLEEIGIAMLVFNLEETLLKLRPYGLPLQQAHLQKCIKKIERIINTTFLKNFICAAKQRSERIPRQNLPQSIQISQQYAQFLLPNNFLYLAALSQKKSASDLIFVQTESYTDNQNRSRTQNQTGNIKDAIKNRWINSFIKQKKQDYMADPSATNMQNMNIVTMKKSKNKGPSSNEPEYQYSQGYFNEGYAKNQSIQKGKDNNQLFALQNKSKINGLTFIDAMEDKKRNSCDQVTKNSNETINAKNLIFKQIKEHLKRNRSLTSIKKKKEISQKLSKQMDGNTRPNTAIFKKCIKLLQNNQQANDQIQKYFQGKQIKKCKSSYQIPTQNRLDLQDALLEKCKQIQYQMQKDMSPAINRKQKSNLTDTKSFIKGRNLSYHKNSIAQAHKNSNINIKKFSFFAHRMKKPTEKLKLIASSASKQPQNSILEHKNDDKDDKDTTNKIDLCKQEKIKSHSAAFSRQRRKNQFQFLQRNPWFQPLSKIKQQTNKNGGDKNIGQNMIKKIGKIKQGDGTPDLTGRIALNSGQQQKKTELKTQSYAQIEVKQQVQHKHLSQIKMNQINSQQKNILRRPSSSIVKDINDFITEKFCRKSNLNLKTKIYNNSKTNTNGSVDHIIKKKKATIIVISKERGKQKYDVESDKNNLKLQMMGDSQQIKIQPYQELQSVQQSKISLTKLR